MEKSAIRVPLRGETAEATYHSGLAALAESHIQFMVGGAFSLRHYTGIVRDTKDLDVFLRKKEQERALQVLEAAGFRTELTFPHWLGKAYRGEHFIDLIFNSGNGVCPVDDGWFESAPTATLLGVEVRLCPAEEMIWQKAFIMERERFDGADVQHLLVAQAASLDWKHLLTRFGSYWRVLFSHLVLFGFVYPNHRHLIPKWVLEELTAKLAQENHKSEVAEKVCQGTLLSREQYILDVHGRGYSDARLRPHGRLTPDELAPWHAAIGQEH